MYSERIARLKSSAIRDILKVTARPGMISFAGGLPAPEIFPIDDVADVVRRIFLKYGPAVLQYSITEGLIPLRERISLMLCPDAPGIGPPQIIIPQGSQQGLDLISKLFLDRGSVVLTENPSYLGALQAFRLFEADIRAVRSDADGIRTDSLREVLRTCRPALVYLMPNFQNPTGTSLSMQRRLELVDMSREHGLIVVEDDPYGELRFEGEKLPSLFCLARRNDAGKNFIYMSSFSKTVAPGLRVAYIAADEEITGKLALLKQGTDLQTNTLGQYIVAEYLESGRYDSHLEVLRKTYGSRRDCMLASMERHFPGSLSWNRPRGGMFLWLELPEGLDAKDILLKCLEHDVAFVPGQEFFPDGSGKNTIRLNFSNANPEKIEEGIRRMGEVLKGLVA